MTNTKNLTEIDAITLKQWIEENTVLLIDVREAAEYAAEHIPDAKLLPLSNFTADQVTPQCENIVLYCRSGNRSHQAVQKLIDAGVSNVYQLQGGLPTWKAAGLPTKVNLSAPISLMRQVQIVAGSLVFLGTVLGAFVSPWFLILSGFVGGGLVFAGVTNTCAMGNLLAKLPYNRRMA
ncbi:Rhodanese-like protein [Trichormus variabilis ATCC 29413]|uniref:Rhodanese-like protein n=2 Tax=Anabaena variabilis TaxID=264691 RepID=Q3MC72_TRIV2|nr:MULTISPECIES: rhodanese-like domain-containing protein [Nostocaceae]ABA21414.1 Rhodanese-like protein [Trichormus variabilis ATCC 29413]MBC1215863.1 rhodanese-like domain-containing protein [Trichormus variabilis ARAD]MBC1255394.1 rhodanese-like domain-containing protein [Trichormus variabilis V5]MBC1269206.1 rhodanese-like domain-containing protein [Trichormus variabilis FSR]MBC1304859.1 rhodanese-like domain-containing protein [Trichormus variabilis N2B]